MHDCALDAAPRAPRIGSDEYRANLEKIFERLHREIPAGVVWATTTPVNEERQVSVPPPRGYGRLVRRNSDVEAYNANSLKFARRFGIEVHDLHAVLLVRTRISTVVDQDDAGRQADLGHRLELQAVESAPQAETAASPAGDWRRP